MRRSDPLAVRLRLLVVLSLLLILAACRLPAVPAAGSDGETAVVEWTNTAAGWVRWEKELKEYVQGK